MRRWAELAHLSFHIWIRRNWRRRGQSTSLYKTLEGFLSENIQYLLLWAIFLVQTFKKTCYQIFINGRAVPRNLAIVLLFLPVFSSPFVFPYQDKSPTVSQEGPK